MKRARGGRYWPEHIISWFDPETEAFGTTVNNHYRRDLRMIAWRRW